MKIGWVADNFFPDVKRGAEIEDYALIQEGIRRGHEIIKMGKLHKNVDVFIVANFVDRFNIGELLAYLSRKPYVKYEHDLRGPVFPYYRMLASEALLVVYRSPFQQGLIERYSGIYKCFLHSGCFSAEYRDMGLERKPPTDVLYIGDYAKEKGYKEMVAWLEQRLDHTIWHYGNGFPKRHPRMKEMGSVNQKDMPRIYNQFQTLIFLPNYPQACCRIITEAYLCKIPNIITNELNGFTSYGWTINDYDQARERLINGHKIFWDKMEEVFRNE
jgi:hypothetical protein